MKNFFKSNHRCLFSRFAAAFTPCRTAVYPTNPTKERRGDNKGVLLAIPADAVGAKGFSATTGTE